MIIVQAASVSPDPGGQTKIEFVTPFDATVDNCFIGMTVPKWYQSNCSANFRGFYVNGNHLADIGSTLTVNMYRADGSFILSFSADVYYNAQYDLTYCENIQYTGVFAAGSPSESRFTGTGYLEFADERTLQDWMQSARQYFNNLPPSVPYMVISCYSKNNIVTIEWDNIDNIPPDLFPSSYTMVFNVRDSAHSWNFLASMPYNSDPKKYKFGFTEALNVMTPEARQQAMADHILNVDVSFGVTDPDIADYPHIDIVNGAWFTIDMSDNSVTATDPGEGNTQYPHSNTDPGTNDSYADDDSEHDPQAPGQALSVDNLVSRSYVVTVAELQAFAAFLWTNDLQATMYANQVSPIENLLSLKRLPFDVGVQQTQVDIFLGNINSHVQGYPTSSGHTQLINQNLKRFKVIHDSYLDYETNITIYLPYCGMQSIPTSLCYEQYKDQDGLPHIQGREFQVTYYYDIIYGTCAAELAVFYTDDLQTKHKEVFAVYNGNCGIDIPVTQSNRASTELGMIKSGGNAAVGILQSFVSGVAGVLSGNPGAAIGSASSMIGTSLREVNNQQTQERHFTTSGGFSSQVASYLSASVVVLYDSPIYTEPSGFAHENGYPTNLFLKLSTLSGYTELDGSIEIEGIACLDEERELLKQALMDGFYL